MHSLGHSLLLVFILLVIFHCVRVQCIQSVRDLEGAARQRVAEARRALTPLADAALGEVAALSLPTDAADPTCRRHSALTLDAYRRAEHWAVDMVEASTQRLTYGVAVDPGRFRQCLSATEPNGMFSGQLCMVETSGVYPSELEPYLSRGVTPSVWTELLMGPTKGVMFAVCVPSTCSPEDVNRRINASLAAINATSRIREEGCTSVRGRPLDASDWAALAAFSGLGLLVVYSTWRHHQLKTPAPKSKVLEVFALQGNWARLVSTSRSATPELACLDGLRALCIVCVCACHRASFPLALSIMHYGDAVEYTEGYGAAMFETLARCIEVFLVIGAFLRAYNFFQDRKKGKPLDAVKSILLRYFRYTPPLAAVVLFSATLLRHISSGPTWDLECRFMCNSCRYFWFLPLLHIDNYIFPLGCVGSSWYLAVDFQMFIISFLVLIPLQKRPRLGIVLLTSGIMLSLGIYFSTTYSNGTHGGQINVDRVRKMEIEAGSYFNTHFRISTYFLGLSLGYFVQIVLDKKPYKVLTDGQLKAGWVTCLLLVVAHLWCAKLVLKADRQLSIIDPLYLVLAKLAGAMVACWLILVCTLGQGGILNRFLSWQGFVPMSKLTIGIFMFDQLLIVVNLTRHQGPYYLDYYDATYLVFGDMCLCSIFATVLYLTVESPCYSLANNLLSSSFFKATSSDSEKNKKHTISDSILTVKSKAEQEPKKSL